MEVIFRMVLMILKKTNDGGYIIVGSSFSFDGDVSGNNGVSDYWILKIDSVGNIEWEQSYGGSDFDIASSVKQSNDKGYIIVGATDSNDGDIGGNYGSRDGWVLKLDSLGNMEWEQNYGGLGFDVF